MSIDGEDPKALVPEQIVSATKTPRAETYDPWQPWREGPMLRRESYTARQLFFLTPEAIHLENRKVFIGSFPPQWIESNAATWHEAVSAHLNRLNNRRFEGAAEAADALEKRKLAELNLATDIAGKTNKKVRDQLLRRRHLLRAMRLRRNKFRHQKLPIVSSDSGRYNASQPTPSPVPADPSADCKTHTTERSRDPATPPAIPPTPPPNADALAPSSSQSILLKDSSYDHPEIEHKKAAETDDVQPSVASSTSSTVFFDCSASAAASQHSSQTCVDLAQDRSISLVSSTTLQGGFEDPKVKVQASAPSYKSESLVSRAALPRTSSITTQTDALTMSSKSTKADLGRASALRHDSTKSSSIPEVKVVEPIFEQDRQRQEANGRQQNTDPAGQPTLEQEAPKASRRSILKGSTLKAASISSHASKASSQSATTAKEPDSLQLKPDNASHLSSLSGVVQREPTAESRVSRWTSHVHLRRGKKHSQKIYHGRFLVQERKAQSAKPTVSEDEALWETQQATRWKECAVLAKQTNDSRYPLVLYFYECVDRKKLVKKSSRSWMRSLAYKVLIDCHYQFSLFSPLDLSLAIWRPKLPGEKHHHHFSATRNRSKDLGDRHRRASDIAHTAPRNHHTDEKSHTKILLVHSQSLPAIMNLAYLLTSATQGAPWLHSSMSTQVTVPSIDVSLVVKSDRSTEDVLKEGRKTNTKNHSLIKYKDLLTSSVTDSDRISSFENVLWRAIKKLPSRLRSTDPSEQVKFGLVWLSPGLVHSPLWLSSIASSFFPVIWINWLIKGTTSLALVKPEAKCYMVSDTVEPPAVEGFCVNANMDPRDQEGSTIKPIFVSQSIGPHYCATMDYYLLFVPTNNAEPPMLASNQNTVEKNIDPFPLDESRRNISWITSSTCIHEIDHHDVVAKLELERRKRLVTKVRGLINLLYYDDFGVEDQTLNLTGNGQLKVRLMFETSAIAELWCKRLQAVSEYWQKAYRSLYIRRAAGSSTDFSITPYLQNRGIVYSGPLFVRRHQFVSFKPFEVLLTTEALILFRVDQKKRPPAHPAQNLPSGSFFHRYFRTIPLRGSYIYTGQAASTYGSSGDAHLDSSNPGVRALPRVYEDGWINQESQEERGFVLWIRRKPRFSLFRSPTDGNQIAFLAQEKGQRDRWATAIRHCQTFLTDRCKAQDDMYVDEERDLEISSDEEVEP